MRVLEGHKRALIVTLSLTLVSPLFGIYLAERVGYHEPIDIVAELLNLEDVTEEITWTPLLDYTVPGLPEWLGYIVSGLLGIGIVLALGYLLLKALK